MFLTRIVQPQDTLMTPQEAMELDLPPQKPPAAAKKSSKAAAGDKKKQQSKASGLQAPRMYSKVCLNQKWLCSGTSMARVVQLLYPRN